MNTEKQSAPTQTQRELFFESEEEARAVFGIEDRYLKAVKATFSVSVVARHGALKLSGPAESVDRAEKAGLERLQQL